MAISAMLFLLRRSILHRSRNRFKPIRSGEKRRDEDGGTAVVNGRWLGNNETRGQVPRREKKAKKLKMCQKGKVQSS